MILTLVTLGKWLEEKSKRKTGDEIEKLIKLKENSKNTQTYIDNCHLTIDELNLDESNKLTYIENKTKTRTNIYTRK